MTRSRNHRSAARRSPVRRVSAVCAVAGAALLTSVTGGQAWADGQPAPSPTRTAVPSEVPSVPPSSIPTPTVTRSLAPSAIPTPAVSPRTVKPSAAAPGSVDSATPSPIPSTADSPAKQPQVRAVPKGAAQAGDGSGAGGSSGALLAGGGVAAVGAGALGFAVLRRRSGARG